MKNILLVIIIAFCAIGQSTNTYTVDKTLLASYVSINAYVTAKGSAQASPIFSGGTWKVIGKCTIPANIDLFNFANGFKFVGNTGSATDTLVISKMSARPMYQIFDTSVTVQFAANAVTYVNPIWRGSGSRNVSISNTDDGHTENQIVDMRITSSLDAMTKDSAALVITTGGVGVEKKIIAGGVISTIDTTSSLSSTTGATIVAGGIGAGKNIYSGKKIASIDTLRTGSATAYAQLDSSNGLYTNLRAIFIDSTKTPRIKDGAGKYWRLKVSVDGTLSADSTGQN